MGKEPTWDPMKYFDIVTTTASLGTTLLEGECDGFHLGSFLIKPEYRKYIKKEDMQLMAGYYFAAMAGLARLLHCRKRDEDPEKATQLNSDRVPVPGQLYAHGYSMIGQGEATRVLVEAEKVRAKGERGVVEDVEVWVATERKEEEV
jgi:hypothetical protein